MKQYKIKRTLSGVFLCYIKLSAIIRSMKGRCSKVKLLFKQRLFSWFDSYDIYDETEQTVYVVKRAVGLGTLSEDFQCLR